MLTFLMRLGQFKVLLHLTIKNACIISESGPNYQKLLHKVSKKVSTDQEMMDLGINLGIPLENIKAARTDNQTSINNAVMHMLYLYWFKDFKGTIEEAQHDLRKALFESELAFIVDELNL